MHALTRLSRGLEEEAQRRQLRIRASLTRNGRTGCHGDDRHGLRAHGSRSNTRRRRPLLHWTGKQGRRESATANLAWLSNIQKFPFFFL